MPRKNEQLWLRGTSHISSGSDTSFIVARSKTAMSRRVSAPSDWNNDREQECAVAG